MGKPTSRDRRSVEWLLVALRRRYRGDVTLSTELEADGIFYHIVMRGNRAEIGRGRVPAPDLRIRGKGIEIARLFLDGLPRDPDASSLEIDGNARQLRTLIGAFESGDPAIAAAR
jgi:hypothetical protein